MKTIFYSWQSDINGKLNNNFIKTCIEKAIRKINKEVDFQCSLDKDTQNRQGSPDIVDTIFSKIRGSDIFIGDITIVNTQTWTQKLLNKRKTPNPNVLVELGYAVKTLGWNRVICINNSAFSDLNNLPFDIRNNRISVYSLKNLTDKKKIEDQLVSTLITAIKSILDNYDTILDDFTKEDNIGHDRVLFNKFETIVTQTNLFESLEFSANNLRSNGVYNNLWRRIVEFGKEIENSFLDDDIQTKLLSLTDLIDQYHTLVAKKFFSEVSPDQVYITDFEEGVQITKEQQYEIDITRRFSYPRDPFDGDWSTYHKRQHDDQLAFFDLMGKIIEQYKTFRLAVKNKLYI